MNAAASAGDETRMSRETPIRRRLQIGGEAAADLPRDLFVDLAG